VSAIFFFLLVPRLKRATSLCHRPTSSSGSGGLECGDAVLLVVWWVVGESLRGRAGPLSVPCSSRPPVLSRRRGSSRVPCMRSLGGWRATGVCSEGGPPFRGDAGQGRAGWYMTWQWQWQTYEYCVHSAWYGYTQANEQRACLGLRRPDQIRSHCWTGRDRRAWVGAFSGGDRRSEHRAGCGGVETAGGPLYQRTPQS
jgi:hypothetical protein